MSETKKKSSSFKAMGLIDEVMRSIDKLGFKYPTPIQRQAIPTIMTGVDVVALARTGSGKTGAFAIPMVDRLKKHSELVGVRAVVLSPTRELAIQTCKVFQLLARYTDLRIALIVGGHSMDGQFDRLMSNPDIVIATPGRLVHHLEQGVFSLNRTEMVVFDEADRLYELGFSEQIDAVLKSTPTGRQILLFSATLPSQLASFAKGGLTNPAFIQLDSENTLSDNLDLVVAYTRNEAKSAALVSLLRKLVAGFKKPRIIVFAATRHHVDYLGQLLEKSHVVSVSTVYGSMDQQVRQDSLNKFRDGKSTVLVVTDVAARGLDIPDVDVVVHYDFPCTPKLFVHRTGRTARAGKSGLCVSLVTLEDTPYLMEVVLFLGARLVLNEPGSVGTKNLLSNEPKTLQTASMTTGQNTIEKVTSDGLLVEVTMDNATETVLADKGLSMFIGSIPYMELDVETISRLLDADTDLQSGKKSMDFAMGPYYKTRPSASKEAVKRAREFVDTECGGQQRLLQTPLLALGFGNAFSSSTSKPPVSEHIQHEAILNSLRSFRPTLAKGHSYANTLSTGAVKTDTRKALENTLFGSRRARELARDILAGENVLGDDTDDTDQEYTPPERTIRVVDPLKKKSFKSSKFYHNPGAPDKDTVAGVSMTTDLLDQHTLNLIPETASEMKSAKFAKKWDNRKKKYVTMRIGADGKAIKEKRSESGKKLTNKDIDKGKNLYKEWVKKTKKRIPQVGELEADSAGIGKPSFKKSFESKFEKKSLNISSPSTPKSIKSKHYNGDVPWQYLTNKQKRLESRKANTGGVTSRGTEQRAEGLKSASSIAKDRKLKETRKTLQNVKKRSEFHKASKDSYKKKQEAKFAKRAAPKRSWVKQRT